MDRPTGPATSSWTSETGSRRRHHRSLPTDRLVDYLAGERDRQSRHNATSDRAGKATVRRRCSMNYRGTQRKRLAAGRRRHRVEEEVRTDKGEGEDGVAGGFGERGVRVGGAEQHEHQREVDQTEQDRKRER